MIQHISVLIPARDEADLLPRCLRSLQIARRALPASITSDVIVVADSCTDGTEPIARALLGASGSVVLSQAGGVGRARALAATIALYRAGHLPSTGIWLSNTDADCCLPPTWLLDQLSLAERGIHAIAGTVDIDSFQEHDAHVPDRFRETYLLHPDGTHPHVHGANLGVRADAYLAVGGWSALLTAEDHQLWQALGESGFRRHSPSVLRVITSGRRTGRAPSGFAAALAAHNHAPDLHLAAD